MLTNEEIIARYGNHPEKNSYNKEKPTEYIMCAACPLTCLNCDKFASIEYKDKCDGFEGCYDRIRNGFAQMEAAKPDPAADVALTAEDSVEILYLCDRRACEVCDPTCRVTKDVRHAKHFELMGRKMVEVEPKPPTYL